MGCMKEGGLHVSSSIRVGDLDMQPGENEIRRNFGGHLGLGSVPRSGEVARSRGLAWRGVCGAGSNSAIIEMSINSR